MLQYYNACFVLFTCPLSLPLFRNRVSGLPNTSRKGGSALPKLAASRPRSSTTSMGSGATERGGAVSAAAAGATLAMKRQRRTSAGSVRRLSADG